MLPIDYLENGVIVDFVRLLVCLILVAECTHHMIHPLQELHEILVRALPCGVRLTTLFGTGWGGVFEALFSSLTLSKTHTTPTPRRLLPQWNHS